MRKVLNMNKSATIREFAAEIGVSEKLAYGMARCEEFRRHKISFDVSIKRPEKKNCLWRIDIVRYYEAREAGLV